MGERKTGEWMSNIKMMQEVNKRKKEKRDGEQNELTKKDGDEDKLSKEKIIDKRM